MGLFLIPVETGLELFTATPKPRQKLWLESCFDDSVYKSITNLLHLARKIEALSYRSWHVAPR